MGKTIGLTFPQEGKAKKGGKEPTKAELAARLEELGVKAPAKGSRDELAKLVAEAEASEGAEGAPAEADER